MTKLKAFLRRFEWWLKHRKFCSGFCPTCRHYIICKHDELTWEVK